MKNKKSKEKRYDRNVGHQGDDNVILLPEDNQNRFLDRREENVKSEHGKRDKDRRSNSLESNVERRYEEEE